MTGQTSLRDIRDAIEASLRELRAFTPAPQGGYFTEWEHALIRLENASLALYVRIVAPTAAEVLDVKTVQDFDTASLGRVKRA